MSCIDFLNSEEFLGLSIISNIIAIVVSIVIAKNKNRSAGWGWLGFLLGWIGVIIVACLEEETDYKEMYYQQITKGPSKLINSARANARSTSNTNTESTWTCEFCGHTNSNLLSTCQSCYKSKTANPTIQDYKWTCSCGQVNNPNATMCIECGKEKE